MAYDKNMTMQLNAFLKRNPTTMRYKSYIENSGEGIKCVLTQIETNRKVTFEVNLSKNNKDQKKRAESTYFLFDQYPEEGTNLSLACLSQFEIVLRAIEAINFLGINYGCDIVRVKIAREEQGLLNEPEFSKILFCKTDEEPDTYKIEGDLPKFFKRSSACMDRYQALMWPS